ncbi:aminotransferase class I/II-fold pyridoxal phosphate-dependent enzyme [Streptomyces sp. FZ201]|uniref:aminotransferase class I/II-fold pyridoxal phosphate-dependent enzyme n=1 Tax=Streptomyces sp. FZ201 TaxID=3057122 RepID=UPI0021BFCD14|nr:aminotransferase class I/II-fold pyridoxal phosphate-dependent enzyme [Streptomyces sp. FZ201]
MKDDHARAPVLEALTEYHRKGRTAFSPPGHKQARGADPAVREVLGDAVFLGDVLASGGLDDRLTRGQVLQRAEELMADVVHADHTFFTTCGSSLSVKAAMLSVAGPHEPLLIGRDAHKSVVSGLILAGIEPVWVEPSWDTERQLAHPPSPDDFERAFDAHPGAKGALVTSPTPYGTCADLRALAEVCHRRGRPLVVDEAWGAHLPFHPDLPTWAMDAGADICVTSVHKMGSGLEQGSVFHLQGDLVPPQVLKTRADLLGSTSPSVLIYAGLDGWRRQMALRGKEVMGGALERAARVRESVEALDGMHVNGRDDFCGPGLAHDLDPLIVMIDVDGLGISGYRAADWLRQYREIDVHLSDHRRLGVQITHGDDEETTGELLAALTDLAGAASGLRPVPGVEVPGPGQLRLEQVRMPRDAFFGPGEDVPAEEAAGRIAAEMITPYPPGIPVVLPGERLTEPVLRYLLSGRDAGMNLPDPSDPHLATIRVTAAEADPAE